MIFIGIVEGPYWSENFALSSDDWIVDAGGFRGEWTDEMLCRYGAKVVIFEPNPPYAARLRDRYNGK